MHKRTRKAWMIAGIVLLPVVYTIVALSSNLGYTPPVPVYMLPPFFMVAILGTPVVISLMLSTIPVVALYIFTLFYPEKKWVFSIELLVLVLNVMMMIAFWNDGVANEGLLFMLIIAAVQATGSVIFMALVYACYRMNTDKIYYMTNLIYFLLLECCLFPVAIIPAESSQLIYG